MCAPYPASTSSPASASLTASTSYLTYYVRTYLGTFVAGKLGKPEPSPPHQLLWSYACFMKRFPLPIGNRLFSHDWPRVNSSGSNHNAGQALRQSMTPRFNRLPTPFGPIRATWWTDRQNERDGMTCDTTKHPRDTCMYAHHQSKQTTRMMHTGRLSLWQDIPFARYIPTIADNTSDTTSVSITMSLQV